MSEQIDDDEEYPLHWPERPSKTVRYIPLTVHEAKVAALEAENMGLKQQIVHLKDLLKHEDERVVAMEAGYERGRACVK